MNVSAWIVLQEEFPLADFVRTYMSDVILPDFTLAAINK